jgi:outer membrane protein OmpA-like peptidoglycan-associated protein
MRRLTAMGLVLGVAALGAGCATKGYVQEQVAPATARIGQVSDRLDQTERRLGETGERVDATRRTVEGHGQRLGALDGRVGEVDATARAARRAADEALAHGREVESRLSQRLANRNKYTTVETRTVGFDFGKADLGDEGQTVLVEVARALQADPNMVVELSGHTDSVGSDRYNLQLSRERVEAVARQLVLKHGVEPRRIFSVGLGKLQPVSDNSSKDGRARNRRVEIKLLAPQA